MADSNVNASGREAAQQQETLAVGELDKLLMNAVKPKTDQAREAVHGAVRTLAQQALESTTLVSEEVVDTIQAIIAELDRKLSEQLSLVMHHADFKELEGSWRGLHFLVNNTETDESLKIRVLNVSKKDVGKTLKRYKGTAQDQSPLFKKIYEEEYGVAGGEPIGCIIGDYHFNHTAPDVAILQGMAQIASAAHCPFIAGADPSLTNMDSWLELNNPRDLKQGFGSPDYAAWRSLRKSEDSRYLGLAMPRFLSRQPYSAKDNPAEGFDFEEDVAGADHSRFVWSNSAYAMGVNITRSFKLYGWCANIRGKQSGGEVTGLPTHTFQTADGSVSMKCPTEIAITDRREKELADCGLMPLVHWKNTDTAAFIGANSLQEPAQYEGPDGSEATANAQLAAKLPYLFATCRFAHYLKCMVRDAIGASLERDEVQSMLHNWIHNYVTPDSKASADVKARYPLAEASVEVTDVEGNPGYYNATFRLRPHFQLEGLSVSLRLVSKLKQA